MATLRDIATQAGLSVPTVSRILNRKPLAIPVRQETIQKVMSIAKKLRYVPHATARNLARQETDVVSFLLSSGVKEGFAEETFSEIFEGAQAECQRQGFKTRAGKLNVERSDLDVIPREVMDQSAAGCILAGYAAEPILDQFVKLDIPFVVISNFGSALKDRLFPTVATDRACGVREAVGHLADLGHRAMAYVSWDDPWAPPEGRLAFAAVCKELGLHAHTCGGYGGGASAEQGLDLWLKLKALSPRPTAAIVEGP